MPVVDAFGARKKHEVMADTWGHLYPKPGSKHAGHFIVAVSDGFYEMTIIRSEFPTLECSPQRAQLESRVLDFIKHQPDGDMTIFRIDCVMWFHKTCNDYNGTLGKIIKPKIRKLKLIGA